MTAPVLLTYPRHRHTSLSFGLPDIDALRFYSFTNANQR